MSTGKGVVAVAGRAKPHRCPTCWAAGNLPSWRRYLPRRCRNGHLTITTFPRRLDGVF